MGTGWVHGSYKGYRVSMRQLQGVSGTYEYKVGMGQQQGVQGIYEADIGGMR